MGWLTEAVSWRGFAGKLKLFPFEEISRMIVTISQTPTLCPVGCGSSVSVEGSRSTVQRSAESRRQTWL
jgi:hypothetical protein